MLKRSKATTHISGPARQRLEHLDMLRGAAALLVLIGHIRSFVFLDYSQLGEPKLAVAPFYLLTGLGHQAVLLFFALSGFLVGGRALEEIRHGTWQFSDYAVHRFARLWTALVPALVATALLDWIGRDLFHLAGYSGEFFGALDSGIQPGAQAGFSLATFLGNIFFLQGIAVPVFGTNGPLWSLANEFWYYFLVPFAWMALAGRASVAARIIAATIAAALLLALPWAIVVYGSIWVAGALAYACEKRLPSVQGPRRTILVIATAVLVLLTTGASLAHPNIFTDIALGLACAAALPLCVRIPNFGGLYGRVAFWLSEISFTLYVVHFPLIALIFFAFFAPPQSPPTLPSTTVAAVLVVTALGYAWAMWWLFERHTPIVRWALSRRLGMSPR